MAFSLKDFVLSAPSSPGVYQMIDSENNILYIGKAKNLKNRLSSYIHTNISRTQALVKKIASITLTICISEEEALFLEHRLIQTAQPPFNILLKDHKSYPFLVLTSDPHPQIIIERSFKHKGQFTQGPYPSSELAKHMLEVIVKVFQIRTCSNYVFMTRSRPCLQYQMQRCSAPCVFQTLDDTKQYLEKIEQVKLFFKEGIGSQIGLLEKKMVNASMEEKFEQAATLRDTIQKLRTIERQTHLSKMQDGACDILAYSGGSMIHHLSMVDGKIEKSQSIAIRNPLKHGLEECIETIIYQLYVPLDPQWIPKVVLADIPRSMVLKVQSCDILVRPSKNELEKSWLNTAYESLKHNQISHNIKSPDEYDEQFSLVESFFLQSQWSSIECIDISHHQGKQAVGAICRFNRQGASRKDYRKYRLTQSHESQNNDPLSIEQTLLRHLQRRKNEQRLPNLLIVDGGKAQLNKAHAIARHLDLENMIIMAMAKDRSRKNGMESYWVISEQGVPMEVDLSAIPMGLLLLQEIRDEAHRIAGQFHYQVMKKETLRHGLDRFSGLGLEKKKLLLQQFGGWSGLKLASVEQLRSIPGIGEKTAMKLLSFFKENT